MVGVAVGTARFKEARNVQGDSVLVRCLRRGQEINTPAHWLRSFETRLPVSTTPEGKVIVDSREMETGRVYFSLGDFLFVKVDEGVVDIYELTEDSDSSEPQS